MSYADATVAFYRKWGISFQPTGHYSLSGITMDHCIYGNHIPCQDNYCGIRCVNGATNNQHHKNFYTNANDCWWGIPSKTLRLCLVSDQGVCNINNSGNHAVWSVVGLGQWKGKGTFSSMIKSTPRSRGIRLIQHEMSHNFGCNDNECTPDYRCIMNGRYRDDYYYTNMALWCPNCASKFNKNNAFS